MEKTKKYNEKVYGEYLPDFKEADVVLGDLVQISGGEFLVDGISRETKDLNDIGKEMSAIKFIEVKTGATAIFHKSHLEGLKVEKHLSVREVRTLKSKISRAIRSCGYG